MNTNVTEKEILGLERQFWNAMKDGNIDAAVSLTKFPCTLASPKGVDHINEDRFRQMMKSSDGSTYKGIDIEDAHVDILNNDTAMITYSIDFKGQKMLDISTWVRDGDKWVCAFHSENPIN